MPSDVIAVYPGTFDPMTLGHEDVVRRACQLFGRLIVGVAAGHHKKSLFTMQERVEMAREALAAYPQVTVESFSGLVRDFVVARGGKAMVRASSSQTTAMPSSPSPCPPCSTGTWSSHSPSFLALRSSRARISGRMTGPSMVVCSMGMSSRSTKSATVRFSIRKSSGSSKSISRRLPAQITR